jgi:hypothetical protein
MIKGISQNIICDYCGKIITTAMLNAVYPINFVTVQVGEVTHHYHDTPKCLGKTKVTVAGAGTIDECDHCGCGYTTGVAVWLVDRDMSKDLCHDCMEKYYIDVR